MPDDTSYKNFSLKFGNYEQYSNKIINIQFILTKSTPIVLM